MDSILKGFKKGKPSARHAKLSDKWGSDQQQSVKEGVTFVARYLGSILVEELEDESQSYGHSISSDAVKTIVAMSKASNKKLQAMSIKVSYRGIVVTDTESNKVFTSLDIHRINFCTADKHHDRVFAYVARSTENETMECHAFMCAKRKVAEAITITVAQAFHLAKEMYDKQQEEMLEKKKMILSDSSSVNSTTDSEKAPENGMTEDLLSSSSPKPTPPPPVSASPPPALPLPVSSSPAAVVQPLPAPPPNQHHHHGRSSSPLVHTSSPLARTSSPSSSTTSQPQQIPCVPPRQAAVMGFEDNFTPPTQSFIPPTQSFTPPTQSLTQPTRSLTPPTQSFTPPTQSFVPPTSNFVPPPNIKASPHSSNVNQSQGFEDNFSDSNFISQLAKSQSPIQPQILPAAHNPFGTAPFSAGVKSQGLEPNLYKLSLSHQTPKQQFSSQPTVDDLLCL